MWAWCRSIYIDILGRIDISARKLFRDIFYFFLLLSFSCSKSPFTNNERQIIHSQNSREIYTLLNTDRINSYSPRERFRLCLAIGNSRDTMLVNRLQSFIVDSSALVRSGAAFALGLLPCQESVNIIRQQVNVEKDFETLQQLILSCGRIGSVSDIISLTSHPHYNELKSTVFKSAVAFFSRGITPQRIVSDCIAALRSKNKIERQIAAIALCRIRRPEIIRSNLDIILPLSESADPVVRHAVARLLKELDFPQKQALFRKTAKDSDWRVRYETALAIPTLNNSGDIWQQLIDDEFPYVVAAALKNPPAGELPHDIILHKTGKMLSREHPMINDAAGFFILSQKDSAYRNIQDSLLNNNLLSPGIIHALCGRIDSYQKWEYVFNQIKNPIKSISTAAYSGLVNKVDTLVERNIIASDQRNQLIIAGLDSDDPVQIYLAADYLARSQSIVNNINEHLYRCLGYKSYQYLDARLAVIKAIAEIRPDDAPKHLFPLLNSRHNRLRKAAYHTLVDTYNLNIRSPIPGPDISRYHDLSHVRRYGLHPIVRFETTRGVIDIQCDAFYAPYTVDAFLACVEKNFYAGTVFHRVVPNFVIQTGDPRGDGWGGPEYHLPTERSPLSFETGMVGMASAGPDTEGSQFFITTAPQYHLDTNYTLFGRVVSGMRVVNTIEIGDKILFAGILE